MYLQSTELTFNWGIFSKIYLHILYLNITLKSIQILYPGK